LIRELWTGLEGCGNHPWHHDVSLLQGDLTMERDLETFVIAFYVTMDDLSQRHSRLQMPASGGPPAQMSDSEGRCLGLAAPWRSEVPWHSERGGLCSGRQYLWHLFPALRSQ
jgi:hypothetical protein